MITKLRLWFIGPALHKTADELEQSKIVLTFNFFALYFLFTVFFTVYLFYFQAYHAFYNSVFSAFSLLAVLLILRGTRSIIIASELFFVTNYISTTLNVLIGRGEISILNGMWFILLNIFMYLNLSRRQSLICFLLVILAFNPLAYLKFNGYEPLNDPAYSYTAYHVGILIQIFAAFAFMFYIIKEFIDKREESIHRLVYNEMQKQALLDAIPDRMFRLTDKGEFLDYSVAPEGVIERKIKGLEDLDLPTGMKTAIGHTISEAIRSGQLQTQELKIETQEGKTLYFEARTKRIGEDEVVSIVRDITQKKLAEQELEASRNFTEKILNSSPNLIWIYDYDKERNIFINREFMTMLGYSMRQVEEFGKTAILMLCHPDDLERLVKHTREDTFKLKDGEIAEIEYRIRDAEGHWHWLLARRIIFSRTADGSVKQTLTTAQEITELKKTEEQLIIEKEKAEDASQAKAQFLSVMSHEIRTPMNAVIGLANVLLHEDPRPDQVENLTILKSSANHLLALINDILDFSKIESGKIEFEQVPFSLAELLNSLGKVFSAKAADKHIELNVQRESLLPYKLIGDPVRLNQVLTNLVDNAIKFTTKGSVKVAYQVMHEDNDTVDLNFMVTDTGIGIPENKKKSIFESFTQASSDTTRQYGGTGLGLAICMKLVELQGGTITVDSNQGSGSVFRFTLRFKKGTPVHDTGSSSQEKIQQSLQGMRILIAEDNEINVFVLKKFLSRWGAETESAQNGVEAVEKLKQGTFDVVLMDLQMPGLDGYGATREVRKLKDKRISNTPIIALTAAASEDTKTEVLKKGMNDYVTKPFNPDELHDILSKYAAKRQD
jgi:PAS domain S-box-containing protein